jgi:NAD(P)-dependent dehydrogenase (short-subunit alcohol dehydrogenase family)
MTANSRKVALVTGAAKRIGRHIALALARRGWDIVVHYRHSKADAQNTVCDIEALGQRAIALSCDLSDEASVKSLLPNAAATLGAISCVVNNASLFEHDDSLTFSTTKLDAHMHANLAAPILLARSLYDATPDGTQAIVINLLDQKLFNLNPDFLSYTLSKAALHSANTMLAQALAPKVRVVGIAPGLTMVSHFQSEAEFADTHTLSPLGESSRPDEVADAVAFAVENRALTGSTILIDAGQHLVPLSRDFSFIKRI